METSFSHHTLLISLLIPTPPTPLGVLIIKRRTTKKKKKPSQHRCYVFLLTALMLMR